MIPITVTPLYVAAIAVLMAMLSTRVGLLRGKHNVALGNGDVRELALGIRRFGNLAEYAAVALLLLLLMEIKGRTAILAARLRRNVTGVAYHPSNCPVRPTSSPLWRMAGRFISAAGTAALMLVAAVTLLFM